MIEKTKPFRKPQGGRPRSLTADQVIDAALELGFDDLTMSALAASLGVSVPTIYQTVGDRNAVVRAGLARIVESIAYPPDRGQHWSDYLRQFAHVTYEQLTTDKHLFPRVLDAGHIIEVDLQVVETFLQVVVARGFSPDEGVALFRRLLLVIMGAVAATCRELSTIEHYGSVEQAMHKGLSAYAPHDLPLIRQATVKFQHSENLLDDALESLIRTLEIERKEA